MECIGYVRRYKHTGRIGRVQSCDPAFVSLMGFAFESCDLALQQELAARETVNEDSTHCGDMSVEIIRVAFTRLEQFLANNLRLLP